MALPFSYLELANNSHEDKGIKNRTKSFTIYLIFLGWLVKCLIGTTDSMNEHSEIYFALSKYFIAV